MPRGPRSADVTPTIRAPSPRRSPDRDRFCVMFPTDVTVRFGSLLSVADLASRARRARIPRRTGGREDRSRSGAVASTVAVAAGAFRAGHAVGFAERAIYRPAYGRRVTHPAGTYQPDRAERLELAVAREGGRCLWCARAFSPLVRATTDHLVPRVKGGPSWLENEVAACRRCNGERGHRSPADWLAECRQRGWEPDAAAVARRLLDLDAAITARGGQRRARPYVRAQLRRLAPAARPGRTGS